jgi:hypothetical protein
VFWDAIYTYFLDVTLVRRRPSDANLPLTLILTSIIAIYRTPCLHMPLSARMLRISIGCSMSTG